MKNLSIFSERLAELLFDNNISIKLLSSETAINESTIRKYLRNVSFPSLLNAIKLANLLNCSFDFLFGLEDENLPFKYNDEINFAKAFKFILDKNNITRYKLQKNTQIAPKLIDDWYFGKRSPSLPNLILLADYFSVSLDILIGREI